MFYEPHIATPKAASTEDLFGPHISEIVSVLVKVPNHSPAASELIPYAAQDEEADNVPAFVMSVT